MQRTKKKPSARASKKDVIPPCNTLELSFCHFVLQGKTYADAARAMGLDPLQGPVYAKRPAVKSYLERYTDRFLDNMAMAETAKFMAAGITRDSIAQRLFFLGNVPAHETRGNIAGQVDALVKLADLMGYTFDQNKIPEALKNLSEDQLRDFAVRGSKPN